jgi:hypothetical protein
MPWKFGFLNDAWSYKKHDRYKRNLEDAIEEKINTMFETKFFKFMKDDGKFLIIIPYFLK